MTELARLAFILLGLHVALSPLSTLAVTMVRDWIEGDDLPIVLAILWISLSLAPGGLLVWKSGPLATRLFGPVEPDGQQLDLVSFLAAGCAVVGIGLALVGAVSIFSAGVAAVLAGPALSGASPALLQSGLRGLLGVVFGILLAVKSKSVSRIIVRVAEPPAA